MLTIDLHAHPSLKSYLFRRRLHKAHRAPAGGYPLTMCCDIHSLREGGVNVVLSAVHVPERQLKEDCWPLRAVLPFVPRVRRCFNAPADETTLLMLDDIERAIERTRVVGDVVERAKSYAEMQTIVARGKIAFVHTIEGAHSLAGKIERLDEFHRRGVALITLAHFYDNGVAPPIDGIPHDYPLRKLGCFREKKDATLPLHAFGQQVIERMFELGMLVDLTHSTPVARADVVALQKASAQKRPLVMSHVGVHTFAPYAMNPTDDEIRAIADTGGVIGVIMMPYWLSLDAPRKGTEIILNTLRHLRDVGGAECAAIGSDFDGFTDPPDDVKEPTDLASLRERIIAEFGPSDAEKIMGLNADRVLREGWHS